MAKIVLGLATSHSPMLCVPSNQWVTSYGAKDQHDPSLPHYSELYRQNSARLALEITPEKCQERFAAVQGAMDRMALQMRLIDYVTCYRSPAGTGVGAGFAEWL